MTTLQTFVVFSFFFLFFSSVLLFVSVFGGFLCVCVGGGGCWLFFVWDEVIFFVNIFSQSELRKPS